MASFAGPVGKLFPLLRSLHEQIDACLADGDGGNSSFDGLGDTLSELSNVSLVIVKAEQTVEVDLCTSVLFVSSSPPNLLAFIDKTLKHVFFQNKEVIAVRMQAFKFVQHFLDAVCHGNKRPEMATAAETVVNTCVEAFKREQSSSAKVASLDALYEATRSAPVGVQQIHASKHLETLFNDYAVGRTGKSKSSNTLQSKLLRVMGLLGREFPACIAPFARQIVESSMHVLRTNFKGAKPIHVLISGAIACLRYLLFDYLPLFTKAKGKKLEELFELIFEHGIVMYAEMKQYHVTRESLQFVADHVGRFQAILSASTTQTETTFKRLLLCCRSTHSGVPELGFLAMQSFLQDTSEWIHTRIAQSTKDASDGRALFDWFMANFAGILKKERQKGASSALRQIGFQRKKREDSAEIPRSSQVSGGVLSTSGDYVNGSKVTAKRLKAAQVADLKVAICGCGAFAKCLPAFNTYSFADMEDILAQMLACVCIFQRPPQPPLALSSIGLQQVPEESQQPKAATDSEPNEPVADDTESSLSVPSSMAVQLQLREGLRRSFLPVLLRACSDFIQELSKQDLRADILARLITICSTVVLVYPRLGVLLRRQLAVELKNVFMVLSSKGGSLDAVLKPVTIQALVRTISSASEEDLSSFVGRFDPRTGLTDNRLLYHYLELWTAIFSTGAPRKLASVVKEEQGIGSVEVLQIGKPSGKSDSIASLVTSSQGAASLQVVFNELMSNVISIIHRLDLSFEAKSDYDGLGELNSKGQPHNSKDCALFHNLITMVETILQTCDQRLALSWLPVLVDELILLSSQSPHISEFYRLLGVCMRLHRQFDDVDGVLDKNVSAFVEDLLSVLPELHGEILAVVLQLVLLLPTDIVSTIGYSKYAHALVVALRLGYTHPKSATAALDALERLRVEAPAQLMMRLGQLLPPLQGFLTLQSSDDDDNGSAMRSYSLAEADDVDTYNTLAENAQKKSDSASAAQGSVVIESLESSNDDSSVQKIQRRILRFLGHLGGRSHHLLRPLKSVLSDGFGLSWASSLPSSALQIKVPMLDAAADGSPLTLKLDALLPRVTELASRSTDRDTRYAACELLHALASVLCGLENEQGRSLSLVFDRLFPVILQLASDADGFIRQLMYPLAMQFARWLSQACAGLCSNPTPHLEESCAAFFEALCDGLGDAVRSSLRTVCADALVQLFKWAGKQTEEGASPKRRPGRGQGATTTKVSHEVSPLHRILALVRHPSPQKRAGGVVALWRLRKFVQASASRINEEILCILETLTIALEMTTDRHATRQLWKTLQVYVRIVTLPNNLKMLVEHDDERSRFVGGIDEFGKWLLVRCHSPNYFCRRIVQKMTLTFIKALDTSYPDKGAMFKQQLTTSWNTDSNSTDSSFEQLRGLGAHCDYVRWVLDKHMVSEQAFVNDIVLGSNADAGTPPSKRGKLETPSAPPPACLASQLVSYFDSLAADTSLLTHTSSLCLQSVFELVASSLSSDSPLVRDYFAFGKVPDGNTNHAPVVSQTFFSVFFQHLFSLYTASAGATTALGQLANYSSEQLKSATDSRSMSETCFNVCKQLHSLVVDDEAADFANELDSSLREIVSKNVNETASTLKSVWQGSNPESNDSLASSTPKQRAQNYLNECQSLVPTLKVLRLLLHSKLINESQTLSTTLAQSTLKDLACKLGEYVVGVLREIQVVNYPSIGAKLAQIVKLAIGFGWNIVGPHSLFECAFGDLASWQTTAATTGDQELTPGTAYTDFFRICESLLVSVYSSRFVDVAETFTTYLKQAFVIGNGQMLCTLFDGIVVNMQSRRPKLRAAFVRVIFEGRGRKDAAAANRPPCLGQLFDSWLHEVENSPTGGSHPRVEFVLDCLSKLAVLSPDAFVGSEYAVKTISSLLGPWIPVHTKVGIIATILPPLFASAVNHRSEISPSLLYALKTLVLQHFPSPSTALPVHDPRSAHFVALLDAILNLLSLTQHKGIFDLLVPSFREGASHAYARRLNRGLTDYVTALGNNHRQRGYALETWRSLFGYFHHDQSDEDLCQRIVCDVCVPLLCACFPSDRRQSDVDVRALEELLAFESRPGKCILQDLMAEVLAAMPIHAPGTPSPANAWKKIAAFELLQCAVCILPKHSIKGAMNTAYLGGSPSKSGGELTKALCMAARKAAATARPGDDPRSRARYCSAAYNCLVAVVAATQDNEKIFTGLLFGESSKKNEQLWANIVDDSLVINLATEHEHSWLRIWSSVSCMPYNSQAVADVAQFGSFSAYAIEPGSGGESHAKSIISRGANSDHDALISTSSSALQGSSLSRSFSSLGVLRGNVDDDEQTIQVTSPRRSDDNDAAEASLVGQTCLIEADALNVQSCMHVLIVAVKHMVSTFVKSSDSTALPAFLKSIALRLSNAEAPLIVRCFYARLITNCATALRQWAQHFLAPLMEITLLVARCEDSTNFSGNGKGSYNFFMRQVVEVIVFDWSNVNPTTSSEQVLANQFFGHFLKVSCISSRAGFHNKLHLAALMCSRWSRSGSNILTRVDVAANVVNGMRNDIEAESGFQSSTLSPEWHGKQSLADNALQVQSKRAALNALALLIENGISLGDDNSMKGICRELFRCLNLDSGRQRRVIQLAAAEVCGLALKHNALPMLRAPMYKLLDHFVRDVPIGASRVVGSNVNRFIECLEKVTMHLPEFLNQDLMDRMVTLLPVKAGPFLAKCLQIVEAGLVQGIGHNCVKVVIANLSKYLTDSTNTVQLVALRIVRLHVTAELKAQGGYEGRIDHAVELAETALLLGGKGQSVRQIFLSAGYPLVECRQEAYCILQLFWGPLNCCATAEDSRLACAQNEVRRGLLFGLRDPDVGLKNQIIAFWNGDSDSPHGDGASTKLTVAVATRFQRSFQLLYDTNNSSDWLGATAYFLLKLTDGADDTALPGGSNDKFIFSTPLQCESGGTPNHHVDQYVRLRSLRTGSASESSELMVPRLASIAIQLTQNDNYMSQSELSFLGSEPSQSGAFSGSSGLTFPTQQSDWLSDDSALSQASVGGDDVEVLHNASESQSPMPSVNETPAPLITRQQSSLRAHDIAEENANVRESTEHSGTDVSEMVLLANRKLAAQRTRTSHRNKKVKFNSEARRQRIMNRQHKNKIRRDAGGSGQFAFRKYRLSGDYPDIELCASDVALPLQMLCRNDAVLAAEVLCSFFASFVATSGSDAGTMVSSLQGIQKMLQESSTSGPIVTAMFGLLDHVSVESILRDLFEKPTQSSPALLSEDIVAVAIDSSTVYRAVCLLEKWVAFVDHEGRNPSHSTIMRKQLCRLYQTMGEADATLALTESTASFELEATAVRSELNNDFSSAFKAYQELVFDADEAEEVSGATDNDSSLHSWDAARLRCLAHLQQWDKLLDNTLELVGMQEDNDNGSSNKSIQSSNDLEALWKHHENTKRSTSSGFVDVVGNFLHGHLFQPVLSGGGSPEQRDEALETLFTFLDSASRYPNRMEFLSHSYPAETALLFALRNDFGRAASVIDDAYSHGLQVWAGLHPLARYSRLKQLQSLQQIVEVEEFVQHTQGTPGHRGRVFVPTVSAIPEHSRALNLARQWLSTELSSFDPVSSWSTVTNLRGIYLGHVRQQFTGRGLNAAAVGEEILDRTGKIMLQTSRGVLKQRALKVAQHFFKRALDEYSQRGVDAARTMAAIQMHRCTVSSSGWESKLSKTLDFIKQQVESIRNERGLGGQHDIALQERQLDVLQAEIAGRMAACGSTAPVPLPSERICELWESGFSVHADSILHELHRQDHGVRDETSSALQTVGSMFWKFSLFCTDMMDEMGRRGLLTETDSEPKPKRRGKKAQTDSAQMFKNVLSMKSTKTSAQTLIQCAIYASLKAIETLQVSGHNSSQLLSIVPRMLFLVHRHPESAQTALPAFISKMAVDTFVPWIDQMLALLNHAATAAAVLPILEKVAQVYPQKMFYSFRVSNEQLTATKTANVGRLPELLRNDLLETFVTKLSGLHHPHLRWKEGLRTVISCLDKKDTDGAWRIFQSLQRSCIGDGVPDGKLHRRWSKLLRASVSKHLGRVRDGKGLRKDKLVQLRKAADEMRRQSSESGINGGNGRPPLRLFSEWLADFDGQRIFSTTGQRILLPGQDPSVASPLVIESFDQFLLTMASKQCPKRLKILGSDMLAHAYLVKGGEDLRLDQRIEQVFETMNGVFDEDAACRQRHIHIRSYSVIPMGTDIGMVEWVGQTSPVKAVIEAEYDIWAASQTQQPSSSSGRKKTSRRPRATKSKRTNILSESFPATGYRQKWIKGKPFRNSYKAVYELARSGETTKTFRECESLTPSFLLRRRLERATSSPEAFFNVRSHFVQSLTAFNIGSYILGIGDRHLENFLLDHCDGTVVGIDFGLAFGGGLGLPAPELIPFRLTRQFFGVHGQDGSRIFELGMVHAMRALSGAAETLLSVMEIFINEPLLDWNKDINSANAKQLADPESGTDEDEDESNASQISVSDASNTSTSAIEALSSGAKHLQWLPNRKINYAKAKLQLGNPAHIMAQEFEDSAYGDLRKIAPKIKGCIFGENVKESKTSEQPSARSSKEKTCQSIEAQVQCLVEMARDPEILGRQWVGLAPWV